MENRKDIGKAFSDKLNSLDRSPRKEVWTGISDELRKKKKKRRIVFFFFWGKALGILLLCSISGFYIYNKDDGFNSESPNGIKDSIMMDNSKQETVKISPNPATEQQYNKSENGKSSNAQTDNNKNNNLEVNNTRAKQTNEETAESSTNYLKKANTIKNSSKIKSKKSKGKFAKNPKGKSKEEKQLLLTETNPVTTDSKTIDLPSLQTGMTDAQEKENKTKKTDSLAVKEKKEKPININMYPKDSLKEETAKAYKKFHVDVFASPTLYGYFSNDSSLDRNLDSLTRKSEIDLSYGFGLTYDLTERFSIRIGYQKINISYVTQNAFFVGNSNQIENYNGIDYYTNVSNQTVFDAANFPLNGSALMDITQKLSYTEIPLELKYKFVDRKLALKSSLGFSYLLLNENTVSISTNSGYTQEIGKTKNLSGTSVSANLGLEAEYPLFKNIKIFVEPIFNYQVKAFSDGNHKPYILGLHTGVRYSFNN